MSLKNFRPIEKENHLQRQIGAKHVSDTGQGSEATNGAFLPQPYIDPYTKRWVCPQPVKVVADVHFDADQQLEDDARRGHPGHFDSVNSSSHKNSSLDSENESSNEVRTQNEVIVIIITFI